MVIKQVNEVEQKEVTMEGAQGVQIRWLLAKEDGSPHFAMREFTVKPGGHTPFHAHDWEHEVYILSGQGKISNDLGDQPLSPGNVILVSPGENHNFHNTGGDPLRFLCLVPNSSY